MVGLVAGIFKRFRGDREPKSPLYRAVEAAISDVQSYARSHGGQIQLIDVSDDGLVKVKFSGACNGCPMNSITLKLGVEEQLRRLVPEVKRVIAA